MRRWWITGAVLMVAFVAVACGGGDDGTVDDMTAAPSDDASDPDAGPEEEVDTGSEPESDADAEPDPEPDADDTSTEAPEASDDAALPTAQDLEDPCADHAGREGEVFIDLVAPVDEQQVENHVEIVGCSNVNEGTVSYRVLDGDGRTLDEGFITAECGTGCVGEFRDSLDLSSAEGEPAAYLQFYSESMADGSEQALTEVMVVLA